MTARDLRPQSVVIFVRPGNDPGGLGIRERVAACYRFARRHDWQVAEVCDTSERTCPDELKRAVAICAHTGARLLVYRREQFMRHAVGNTKVVGVVALAERATS